MGLRGKVDAICVYKDSADNWILIVELNGLPIRGVAIPSDDAKSLEEDMDIALSREIPTYAAHMSPIRAARWVESHGEPLFWSKLDRSEMRSNVAGQGEESYISTWAAAK